MNQAHLGKGIQCPTCDKAFLTNQSLSQHLLTHSGQKPHKCETCNATFAAKSNMIRHKKTQHNSENWTLSALVSHYLNTENPV